VNWIRRLTGRIRYDGTETDDPPSAEEESVLQALEKRLGYRFRNLSLLRRATTHPSLAEDRRGCEDNQRLEFLGDSILGAILAEKLFRIFPEDNEGILTKGRSVLARGDYLSKLARDLGIHDTMRMSRAEIRDGGNERDSTLEDAIEAIVGAIYLASGMQATRKTVLSWYGDMEETLSAAMEDYNPKGRLQEIAQALHGPDQVRYLIDREEGPSHRKRYSVSVEVAERKLGSGSGRSKKEAEEEAARKALQSISRKRKKTNKRATGSRQKNESKK
ncbi:uncharacterized protein METZ01_LOCUS250460, partial [marine metagenome]